jgi:hypothetical protein
MMKINLSDDDANERRDDENGKPLDGAHEIDDTRLEDTGGYAEDLAALMGDDVPDDKPEETVEVPSIDDDFSFDSADEELPAADDATAADDDESPAEEDAPTADAPAEEDAPTDAPTEDDVPAEDDDESPDGTVMVDAVPGDDGDVAPDTDDIAETAADADDGPDVVSEPEPESDVVSEPEPEPEPESDIESDLETGTEPELESEVVSELDSEPSYGDLLEALQDEPGEEPEDIQVMDIEEPAAPDLVELADDIDDGGSEQSELAEQDADGETPLDETVVSAIDDAADVADTADTEDVVADDATETEYVAADDVAETDDILDIADVADDAGAVETADDADAVETVADDVAPDADDTDTDETDAESLDAAADADETDSAAMDAAADAVYAAAAAFAEEADAVEEAVDDTDTAVMDADDVDDTVDMEIEMPPAKKGRSKLLVVVLLIIAVGAVAWFQQDMLLGLIGGDSEPVQQVQAPTPSPTPAPVPDPVTEPDPVFVILATISDEVPAQAWLSSLVVSFDGSYEIRGIAFSSGAIDSLKVALAVIGEVTEGARSGGGSGMIGFSLAGALGDVAVPKVLDPIPGDVLAGLADTIETRADDYGVSFMRLPKAGESYGERVLPFALEGSYDGLRRVVGDLCPEGSDYRIYRLSILPVAGSGSFDRVSAAFSLRTISAI